MQLDNRFYQHSDSDNILINPDDSAMKKSKPINGSNALDSCIRDGLRQYFKDLNGSQPSGVYDMLLLAMERPLLEEVMEHCEQNQTLASQVLGIGRATLRKKLLEHGLIK